MRKVLRYVVAGIIICLVFAYYIVSMHSYSKKESLKNNGKKSLESKLLLAPEDMVKEDYFYSNGDAFFDINVETKTISIAPHEDIFVTLSRKLKLDGDRFEKLVLDFEYKYELSGNNNPHKDAGGVIILISKNGYRSLDTTSKICTKISPEWEKCSYIVDNPGSPVAAIVRFGATSYYKKVMFRNISFKSYR